MNCAEKFNPSGSGAYRRLEVLRVPPGVVPRHLPIKVRDSQIRHTILVNNLTWEDVGVIALATYQMDLCRLTELYIMEVLVVYLMEVYHSFFKIRLLHLNLRH